MRAFRLSLMLAATFAITACNQQTSTHKVSNAKSGITISDARLVLPAVTGNPAAAYFSVNNETDQPAKILTVDVGGAGMAMMHETLNMGARSTMQDLSNTVVPAHQSLVFSPGGKHVMVTGLTDLIKKGTNTTLTLNFDDGQKAGVDLPVVPAGAAEKPAG